METRRMTWLRRPAVKDAVVLAAVLVVFAALVSPLVYRAISFDEQIFLWAGWSMLKGLVPYRDFVEIKPPVVLLTHAAAVGILGVAELRYRFFFVGLHALAVLVFAWALLQRGTQRLVAFLIVTVLLHVFLDPTLHDASLNDAESTGLAFYILGLSCLLFTNPKTTAGGALLALAVLCKEPFLFPVGATWVSMAIWRYGSSGFSVARTWVAQTTIGASTVVAVFLIGIGVTGGFSGYLTAIQWSMTYAKDYCVWLGIFREGDFASTWAQNLAAIKPKMTNPPFVAFSPLLLFAFATTSRTRLAVAGSGLLALAAGLYTATLGHCYWTHYFIMAITGFLYLSVIGGDRASTLLAGANARNRRGALIVAGVLAYFAMGPHFARTWPPTLGAPRPGVSPALVDFIRNNSGPEEKIFTTGAPGLYVFADRLNAINQGIVLDDSLKIMASSVADPVQTLRDQLVQGKPRIIVLDPFEAVRKRRFMEEVVVPYMQSNGYEKINDQVYRRPL